MFDCYPSEEDLEEIKNWPHTDFVGLMDFVSGLWSYPDYFEREWSNNKWVYNISTGGWSGNEDIIGALMENRTFWGACWHQSKRGGHYIFTVKE